MKAVDLKDTLHDIEEISLDYCNLSCSDINAVFEAVSRRSYPVRIAFSLCIFRFLYRYMHRKEMCAYDAEVSITQKFLSNWKHFVVKKRPSKVCVSHVMAGITHLWKNSKDCFLAENTFFGHCLPTTNANWPIEDFELANCRLVFFSVNKENILY